MTNVRIRAGAAAALAAAGIGAAVAAAAPASATPAGQMISFTEHQTSDQNFNLGSGHGIAVGAVELSADKLMQGSRQIGHDGGSCTITRLSAGTADDLCNVVVVLARGQIDPAGLVTSTPRGPGTFQLAVTGGTGRYQNARGYARPARPGSPAREQPEPESGTHGSQGIASRIRARRTYPGSPCRPRPGHPLAHPVMAR